MSKLTSDIDTYSDTNTPFSERASRKLAIMPLGMSLGLFLVLTFVLCVLFDLWFPILAMNPAWSPLLPGFIWITWTSFFLGLAEVFAYGWYIAFIFVPLYNFFAVRPQSSV